MPIELLCGRQALCEDDLTIIRKHMAGGTKDNKGAFIFLLPRGEADPILSLLRSHSLTPKIAKLILEQRNMHKSCIIGTGTFTPWKVEWDLPLPPHSNPKENDAYTGIVQNELKQLELMKS